MTAVSSNSAEGSVPTSHHMQRVHKPQMECIILLGTLATAARPFSA